MWGTTNDIWSDKIRIWNKPKVFYSQPNKRKDTKEKTFLQHVDERAPGNGASPASLVIPVCTTRGGMNNCGVWSTLIHLNEEEDVLPAYRVFSSRADDVAGVPVSLWTISKFQGLSSLGVTKELQDYHGSSSFQLAVMSSVKRSQDLSLHDPHTRRPVVL